MVVILFHQTVALALKSLAIRIQKGFFVTILEKSCSKLNKNLSNLS